MPGGHTAHWMTAIPAARVPAPGPAGGDPVHEAADDQQHAYVVRTSAAAGAASAGTASMSRPEEPGRPLAGLSRPPPACLSRPPLAGLSRPPLACLPRPPLAGLSRPPLACLSRLLPSPSRPPRRDCGAAQRGERRVERVVGAPGHNGHAETGQAGTQVGTVELPQPVDPSARGRVAGQDGRLPAQRVHDDQRETALAQVSDGAEGPLVEQRGERTTRAPGDSAVGGCGQVGRDVAGDRTPTPSRRSGRTAFRSYRAQPAEHPAERDRSDPVPGPEIGAGHRGRPAHRHVEPVSPRAGLGETVDHHDEVGRALRRALVGCGQPRGLVTIQLTSLSRSPGT